MMLRRLLIGALAFLLVACETPVILPETGGNTEPLSLVQPRRELPPTFFEQAANGAEEVIDRYLSITDEITARGGTNTEPIKALVSPSWLIKEREGFESYQTRGLRSVGSTSAHSVVIQNAHITLEGAIEVGAMVCVEGTDLFVIPAEYDDPPEVVWQWHPDYEDFEGEDSDWEDIEQYLSQPDVTWGTAVAIQTWLVGESFESLVIDSWEPWWGVYEC